MRYLHETPFGLVAVAVNPQGGLFIEPAYGLTPDGRGAATRNPVTGVPAVLAVNRVSYTDFFRVEPNERLGQYHRGFPENDNKDPREFVADFSMWSSYTDAARIKLGAYFIEHRAEFATPERIARARYEAAERAANNARESLSDAAGAKRDAQWVLDAANDELQAASDSLDAGDRNGWAGPGA
jgi:hypothetical protein